MTMFRTFEKALEHWRMHGGALNYHCPLPCDSPPSEAWEVADAAELVESIDVTPKEATVHALQQGGMSEAEIAEELEDWQD